MLKTDQQESIVDDFGLIRYALKPMQCCHRTLPGSGGGREDRICACRHDHSFPLTPLGYRKSRKSNLLN